MTKMKLVRPQILNFDQRMQLILDHHTTPEEAGIVFTRAAPKLAVYTHYVLLSAPNAPEVTVERVLERTRTTYSGALQGGDDLMRFEIGELGSRMGRANPREPQVFTMN